MPAVPFVISFVVDEAIGAAIAEEVGSQILGKAITSGISGAISSTTQGGDPVTGAEKGFVGGAAGGLVGEAVAGAPAEIDPVTGVTEAPATGLAATDIPTDVSKSITRGTSATAGALARGQSPKQAVVGGLVTGGLDYAYSDQPSDFQTSAEKAVIGKGLTDIFAPSTQYRTAQTVGGDGTTPTSVTTTGAGQAPGSQALAQALRIGDPGAPIFGGDKDKEGAKQSGWNVESLRYMGQES
jgi:hypothetical protein